MKTEACVCGESTENGATSADATADRDIAMTAMGHTLFIHLAFLMILYASF